MIAMPNADSHNARVLQEDNTDLVRIACMPMPAPPLAHALNRAMRCCTGVRIRAQVPRVSNRGQLQLHATLPDLCTLLKSGIPRRTWTRRASMRCSPLPTATPHSHSPVLSRLQVAARRFCLVAAGARQPSPRVVLGFKLTCVPPCLAQTTRSSPRCVPLCSTQTCPLHLRLSHTHPPPLPFARADLRERREAPVRTRPLEPLSTRPRRRWPTAAHPPTPCLRRMGEISERLLQLNHLPRSFAYACPCSWQMMCACF
jgi:hypothetical protein